MTVQRVINNPSLREYVCASLQLMHYQFHSYFGVSVLGCQNHKQRSYFLSVAQVVGMIDMFLLELLLDQGGGIPVDLRATGSWDRHRWGEPGRPSLLENHQTGSNIASTPLPGSNS